MKRASQFFLVDSIAFILFVGLVATGLLTRYILPAGTGHSQAIWGMTRHDWGGVHFWIAVGLFATMAVHIFFHWRWVMSMARGTPREPGGRRGALALVGLAALVAVAAAPFFSPIEQTEGAEPGRNREEGVGVRAPAPADALDDRIVEIEGSMSLAEVERATGVPVAVLLEGLGLPPETGPEQHLGQLRRTHGFEIDDVREIVAAHSRH
jgi:hypothetical protein